MFCEMATPSPIPCLKEASYKAIKNPLRIIRWYTRPGIGNIKKDIPIFGHPVSNSNATGSSKLQRIADEVIKYLHNSAQVGIQQQTGQ